MAVLLLLAAGVYLAGQTLDTDTRTRLRVNCLCRQGKWQDCLDELRRAPGVEYSASLLCDVNRALFETGQLPTAMFFFPQKPGCYSHAAPTASTWKVRAMHCCDWAA